MNRDLTRENFCDEILELIDSCYFHPSRDNEFPTLTIKYVAQCAMLRLWNTYELYMNGKRYDNHEIRRIMDEEMLPEYLFTAIRFFVTIGRTNDVELLSRLIFWVAINNEEIFVHGVLPKDMECGRYSYEQ